MTEQKLPRGIVQPILDALEAEGWCTIGFDRPVKAGLLAVWPAIERAILKRAAERIILLEALANAARWRSSVSRRAHNP